jgi:hypothetical protein
VASGPASRRARGGHRSRGHRAAGATYDTAHLSGGAEATGTITFKLYGPDDATCAGEPVFVGTAEVIGDGYYRSGEIMPTATGTYRWVVDYSGDGNNNAAGPTACGAEAETILVSPAPKPSHPQLSTSASLSGKIGARHAGRAAGLLVHDAATLSGGSAPTGEITFYLYGPNNATCSGTPVFTTATQVHGNGIYNSEAFAPTAPGVYRSVAKYSGDGRNHPAGPNLCDDGAEQVHVTAPAEPQLTSSASQAVTIGGAIRDTAHLSGGFHPSGTITFRLYAPGDRTCAGNAVFASTVAVAGNNDYTSHSFIPTSPGGYRWIVGYSGDFHNHRAGPTVCGDPAELAIVRPSGITPVVPNFSTTASYLAGVGMPVYDIAHLSGGIAPGGAITFTLYGPKEPSCSRPPAFTAIAAVTGNGDYRSSSFIAPRPGTYHWVVTYSGDARNSSAGPTSCGEGKETASVAARPGPNPNSGPNIAVRAARTHHRAKPLHRRKPPPPPPPVTG